MRERGPVRLKSRIMSRFETAPFSSQDDLSPEIERRLQVEELWARRSVLEDLMNAERRQVFVQRYASLTAVAPAGSRLARLTAKVVPIRSRMPAARAV